MKHFVREKVTCCALMSVRRLLTYFKPQKAGMLGHHPLIFGTLKFNFGNYITNYVGYRNMLDYRC